MLQVMQWLREKITATMTRWRARKATPLPPPKPIAEPAPPPDDRFGYGQEVQASAPPDTYDHERTRQARRKKLSDALRELERRRLKHDKFVTPKGELPPTVHREPAPPKPKPIKVDAPVEEDRRTYIRGKHHEDTQEVLYDETEFFGMFNFRDTILQQLERYFVYLARMKRYDKDSFGLYRQYGATLLPYIDIGAHDRKGTASETKEEARRERAYPLAEWFHQMRPSFGCFVYGADPETEKYELEESAERTARDKKKKKHRLWVPKFMYFVKIKKPTPKLQLMTGGDTYSMTVYWDRPHDPKSKQKYGIPQEFGIFVSHDGKRVIALRTLSHKRSPVWSRKWHETFYIPQRRWEFPAEFARWAREQGETPQVFLTRLFKASVQRHSNAQRGVVRIAVTKDDMTAVFSVNHLKMGYFFQDRDIQIGETGARKRIFHMVKAHTRRDGSEVPMHFRGEREFTWADYKVLITVPGWDHTNYDEFNVGTIDEHWMTPEDGPYADQTELGRRFAEAIKRQAHIARHPDV